MTTLREAATQALEALKDPWKAGPEGVADAIAALKAALSAEHEGQPEPNYSLLPTNKKEPRPGLVNLEEFPGFLYESSNGWHIGDMKVVKWLLKNREADYWKQFKEKP